MSEDAQEIRLFSAKLRALAASSPQNRPLLCSGSPLTCIVAVVGINPASTTPFWPHWSDDAGMDRRAWIASYRELHGGKFSRSRAALERFVVNVEGRVLELNAHVTQSRRLANLKSSQRTTEILGFVLDSLKPRTIVCAGKSAAAAVHQLKLTWAPTVIPARHFIYWGFAYESELVAQLNAMLKRPGNSEAN